MAGLALALAGMGGSEPQDSANATPESWFVLQAPDGAVIGHGSEATVPHDGWREVVDDQDIFLTEQDAPASHIHERTVRSEDRHGRTYDLSMTTEVEESWIHNEAHIAHGRIQITHQTPADKRTFSLDLPADARFDEGGPLLQTWDPVHTPRLEFHRFDIGSLRIERVVLELTAGAPPDADGRLSVLKKTYDGSALMGVSRFSLDRDRNVVDTVTPMFGTSIRMRMTDQATATKPQPAYRILSQTMTRSPFLIANPAAPMHIRYRFAFKDGLAFDLPNTGDQTAVRDADGATLDICTDCGPGLPTDKVFLRDALRSTEWMQSDDPRLQSLVRPVLGAQVSQTRRMEMLMDIARPYLGRVDFNGHFSALETLSRRAGDCTEAATLLAALGRAAGIPTKVADGLVYSRERYHGVANAFLPHSWTLAYVDGHWRSFDLALDTFDSTHVALVVGDGDARSLVAAGQLGSLLVWRNMAEVRTRSGG